MKPIMIISSVHRWNDSRIFYKQAVSLAKEYSVELHAVADFKVREEQGVKVAGLPPSRRIARPLNWFRLFIRALRSKARVVHFHDPELLPLGFILRLLGRKVIYDVHEDFPASIYSKEWIKGRKTIAGLADRVEKWLAGRMSALIFAEQYYKDNFTRVKVRKVDILNYPVFSGPADSQRPRDVYNLVYAGGITEIRGALTMVEALGSLPLPLRERTRLYLVGEIAPALMAKIQALVDRFKLEGQVICPGRVTLQEVYKYYGQSHLGLAVLHPEKNYIKSLATKIFEYMSVGIPVVASNFPLWTELVEGNGCGLTADPKDPRDVAEKICQLLTDPQAMEGMGDRGAAAFRSRYNWDVEQEKLLKLYRELMDDGGGRDE